MFKTVHIIQNDVTYPLKWPLYIIIRGMHSNNSKSKNHLYICWNHFINDKGRIILWFCKTSADILWIFGFMKNIFAAIHKKVIKTVHHIFSKYQMSCISVTCCNFKQHKHLYNLHFFIILHGLYLLITPACQIH